MRILNQFLYESTTLDREHQLPPIPLETLQDLFDQPRDNLMYEVYPVTSQEQLGFFSDLLSFELNINLFDYYLDCYESNS